MTNPRIALASLLLALVAALLLPTGTAGAVAASGCARTLASYPTLEPGDQGRAVRTLQCALNDLGYGPVVVDGDYAEQTQAAVTEIEDGFEGPRDQPGLIDAGMWTLLYGRQLPSRRLALGDQGRDVKNLQRALRAAGGDIVVDGDFAAQTRDVLRAYQRAQDIRPAGRYNRETAFWLSMGASL